MPFQSIHTSSMTAYAKSNTPMIARPNIRPNANMKSAAAIQRAASMLLDSTPRSLPTVSFIIGFSEIS